MEELHILKFNTTIVRETFKVALKYLSALYLFVEYAPWGMYI